MKTFPILLAKYQPIKLPQITILKITGKTRPFTAKPLNNGLPRYALTTTQSQSEGSKPNRKPLSTVGCFTSKAKMSPQIPPAMINNIAAIN
ncbi:MAG: hypothetical protein H0X70_04835 [Segetibacter sp.]|nr:hypothetical protein [Segetibacter sp.]